MDKTLAYLRESLSNWTKSEEIIVESINSKLENNHYKNEVTFLEDLSEEEAGFLTRILENEVKYADDQHDSIRKRELMNIYELLT
ncbi:sporulation protein [Pseudalkalibacillus caeni]|uniref:Sporulation protein n=1 Tax=Exobacillus caeni TaxID=2574798 RepID=A0A5R9F806_9BACL|nr:sporulation protein [Pseudalkalibacillus caeni]TLS35865.1 sporulation protein [Pseudalkalibacillus caeni]